MISSSTKERPQRILARISRDIEEILVKFGKNSVRKKSLIPSTQSDKIDVYVQEPHEKELEIETPQSRKPAMSSSLSCYNEDNKGEAEMDYDDSTSDNSSLQLQKNIIIPLATVKSEDGEKLIYHWHIIIPPRYPFEPPHVYNLNNITHDDIDSSGRLLVKALSKDWSAVLTLSSVICILELFICGTLKDMTPQDILHLDSNYDSSSNSKGYDLEGIQRKGKDFYFRKRRYESMERDDSTQTSPYESPIFKKSRKRINKGYDLNEEILISTFSKKLKLEK
ncbi:unnamed protein product [Moneuplotes crassus]|uniref:UBC core domain-containing protein n=2 Tax=Euplotes crassus TaxID=5936 RepID=A0AAD1XAP8_EUPCR|nr:unnamed protein product [Moneuplotes crassus]